MVAARYVPLPRLTDDLCGWAVDESAWTVRREHDGTWTADWSDDEPDSPPPATLAWLTWHLQWWMTEAVAEVRNEPKPNRESIRWPGSADGVRAELRHLVREWTSPLTDAGDDDLDRLTCFPWPDPRPLHRLLAWVPMELMKNAAEIGAVLSIAIPLQAS